MAASLTAAHGDKCSIVMLEDVTLERFYGKEVGGYFQGVLEEHGVDVTGARSSSASRAPAAASRRW